MADENIARFAARLAAGGGRGGDIRHAATVAVLRDGAGAMETLMLRKSGQLAFGGMWVFPGGRIDEADGHPGDSMEARARCAAAREAAEEAGLRLRPGELRWFSHWTPPALGGRRYITWFYLARDPGGELGIDGGEIEASQWLSPAVALRRQAAGEIELAPPTHVTLHYLSRHASVADALRCAARSDPPHYATRIAASGDELVAMWEGDAGYASGDPGARGGRHRLRMRRGGWIFEDADARAGPAANRGGASDAQ